MLNLLFALLLFTTLFNTEQANAFKILSCSSANDSECSYEWCEVKFESYPNPVVMVRPSAKRLLKQVVHTPSIRIHFHGFTQNKNGTPYNPDYDVPLDAAGKPTESLLKMIQGYEMNQGSCSTESQWLVMPVAYYRCDQYKEYFKDQEQLNAFISEIEKDLGSKISDGQLTISGHSAGGDWISKLLKNQDSRLGRLLIFDGIYSDEALESVRELALKSWIPKIDLVSVMLTSSGRFATPFLKSRNILKGVQSQLKLPLHISSATTFRNDLFRVDLITKKDQSQVRHFYQNKNITLDHWSIVRSGWML